LEQITLENPTIEVINETLASDVKEKKEEVEVIKMEPI
jgi:hypothetical protein